MSNLPDNFNAAAYDATIGSHYNPPNRTIAAAADLVELANRLGVDWAEADDVVQMHECRDGEADDALADARRQTDATLLRSLARQMDAHRAATTRPLAIAHRVPA